MATIPTPNAEDLALVCVSGVGSSMIKNAAAVQKVPLQTLMGTGVPPDAVNLINVLLVFNPHKRLTAEEALQHEYVSRFHDPEQEIVMQNNVIIPLNDDVRLSVDDYRNKLYEIMTVHQRRVIATKPNVTVKKIFPPEVYSKVSNSSMRHREASLMKAAGDYNQQMKSTSEVPKRKFLPSRTSLCNSFNSYNKSHGIITQSALMELRAAGLR
ncbi:unnamed protein product [Callosobruchus maculatus]|uniref:Protein kinase domain-containing protein n=1 Tax=Callosobruchus maculatus TaxID=64391 RepID=A0A653D9Q8_CALMS|nr:unnamed protein product [Callosobruchus maculatus]